MKAYTDYPFNGNEKCEVIEVEVLSYDRNKYCTIRWNGDLLTVKSGYLYQDDGLTKLIRDHVLKLPIDYLSKKPTRHQYENERRKNRHTKVTYVVYDDSLDTIIYHTFENLNDALKKAASLDYFHIGKQDQWWFNQVILVRDTDSYPYVYLDYKNRTVIKKRHLRKFF